MSNRETERWDLESLLHNPVLNSKLDNLHKDGRYLEAACPHCGGVDRFFSGPKYNYRFWSCRQCGSRHSTTELLGKSPAVVPHPTVRPWQEEGPDPEHVDAIRAIYRSLVDFAQDRLRHTSHAQEYLAQRGIPLDFALNVGLGYIDSRSYRDWYINVLAPSQRRHVATAGLPDGAKSRFSGYAAKFAGGYKGKILFSYFDENGNVVDVRTRSISNKDTVGGEPVRYISPRHSQAERGVDVPFGVDTLSDHRRVILTEGEFKRLVPMAQGLSWPVLSLRGVSDPVKEYLPYLAHRLIILAFDNDEKRDGHGLTAGETATVRIGRLLQAHAIDVAVLDPSELGVHKGIDDFVQACGVDELSKLVAPGKVLTLSEYEGKLSDRGLNLKHIKDSRFDPGTVRRWMPADHVDEFCHRDETTVSLEEGTKIIEDEAGKYFSQWKKGDRPLLITAQPGVGKTFTTVDVARTLAGTDETVAVFLPSHETIDEKTAEGLLENFQHIYGHRWDSDSDGERNCQHADTAQLLLQKGYDVGGTLCSSCAYRTECESSGYRSQFKGKRNRAYTHGHLYSNYPESENCVICDELSHKPFIETTKIFPGDLLKLLQDSKVIGLQREVLQGLHCLFQQPRLDDLKDLLFYEVLYRFFPKLYDVDAWGDGSCVKDALDKMAREFVCRRPERRSTWEAEELPDQYGMRLFGVLSDDVQRIKSGKSPTGRIRLVVHPDEGRYLELVAPRGSLPDWYRTRPVIILNATANPEIMEYILGDIDIVSPQVGIRDGNEIIQDITYNNAKTGLVGKSPDSRLRRGQWFAQIGQWINLHPGGESDTTIITTKQLILEVQKAFPEATVAYYGNLEGRNDLQSGLLILANPPSFNLDAVKREAVALFQDVDTSTTRRSVAFQERNADGHFLTVEQVDATDPKMRALVWQYRDAWAIQAAHRSRITRKSGRTVVLLFARPIPGLRPNRVIKENSASPLEQNDTFDRIIKAAQSVVETDGGLTIPRLAEASRSAARTVKKYWSEITHELDLEWFDLPVLQPLANGAINPRKLRVALPQQVIEEGRAKVSAGLHPILLIALSGYIEPLMPDKWTLDLSGFEIESEVREILEDLFRLDTEQDISPNVSNSQQYIASESAHESGMMVVAAEESSDEKDKDSAYTQPMLLSFQEKLSSAYFSHSKKKQQQH